MANEVADNKSQFTPQPETAKRFFDRAAEVAMTNNFDYAMELYRDGIKWDPDSLDVGHKPLLEIGRKRRAGGGKGPGMGEQVNARKAKQPNEKLSWAAYLLAKDPENPRSMESLLHAALAVEAKRTAKWIAILLVEANRSSNKPSLERYLLAVEAFQKVRAFDEAVKTCQDACRLKPNDMNLTTRLKNLMAEQTMKKGNYEDGEDFKGSLADRTKTFQDLQDQSVTNIDATVDRQIADARRDLAASPNQAGKVFALVEALCKRGQDSQENEAVAALENAWAATQSYRFRERMGEIRMRQLHRKAQAAVAALRANPEDQQLKLAAQKIVAEVRNFDEQEYAERVANYPTDLTLKYEYGRRLFDNKKFDLAIPVLQDAANDAKSRLRAMNLLGQSFFGLKFFTEAVETYRRAIGYVEQAGSDTAKDLYYHLGLALEQMGDIKEADKAYSQVVQWDFNYRDVRQRIQRLRKRDDEPSSGSAAK